MSVSKGWRRDLDLAKTIIDAKKSVHSTLFEQIDLTRFLDDEYILKLNDRNELFISSSFLSSKYSSYSSIANIKDGIAEDEEISSFWQYNNGDISTLSHFLISQTSSLCQGNIVESVKFKRQLLLQRIILSQTDNTQKLLTKKARSNLSANNTQSIESSHSFISLPFEAQIGIKLLCRTLDSIEIGKDKVFSLKIIESLLPHLKNFIIALSTKNDIKHQDFGVLNRICNFLCSMLNTMDTNNEIVSPTLCIILALSILSNDFNRIIYVIHRILIHSSSGDLKLHSYQALNMIYSVESHASNSKNESNKHSSCHFEGGSLYCFGKGEHGRLGTGQNHTHKQCTNPCISPKFNTSNCTEISCFSSHNLCIDTEGHVYSWGKGEHGRLGTGQNKSVDIPRLIEPLRQFKAVHVAVGLSHSLVLTEDGNVWSFGSGEHGRLGHGDSAEIRTPKLIEALKDVHIIHISCGAYHCCGISSAGSLFTWGKNDQGQCGLGSVANKDVMIPTMVELDNEYKAAYCDSGWEHTLLITRDGLCMSWGQGYEGHRPVLGHGTEKAELKPKLIDALCNVRIVDVACGWDHSLCVSDDGNVYTWGDATHGKLGHSINSHQNIPKIVQYFNDNKLKCVLCKGGSNHSAVITSSGGLYMFGNGTDFQLGQGSGNASQKNVPIKVERFNNVSIGKVSLGDKYTLCITGRPSINGNIYHPLSGLLPRRPSMIGLERRRSSLFSGTDMSMFRGINDPNNQLLITFDDRLARDQYKIYDHDEDSKSEELDKDKKTVDKDKKSADKDKKTADKDQQIADKDKKSTDKDKTSIDKVKKRTDKDQQIADKDKKSTDKDKTSADNKKSKDDDDTNKDEENKDNDIKQDEKDNDVKEETKSSEKKEDKLFDVHTTATILLAHLDRICGETDFCTVDDPAKELRKLQNDPSLIQTNSLIKRRCDGETLKHLFEIIKYYIDALCQYKETPTSPSHQMEQIEEQKIERESKDDINEEAIEYEDQSITFAYFILSCLRLLRSKIRIAALIYKKDKEEFEECIGSFDFNHLQKSLLQFMGENTDNDESATSLQNIDHRIHRLIQFEATALLSAGIELFYPSHSTRIELVNTLLDGSASSIFTQALLAQFSQPALLQGFLPAMVIIENLSKKEDIKAVDAPEPEEIVVVESDTRDIRDNTEENKREMRDNNEEEKENKEKEKEEKIEEDDTAEYKIDAAKLLDLLTILMKRSHVESLKMIEISENENTDKSSGLSSTTAFLSCLQRESLIWITKRLRNNESLETQWISILGEHANDLCQTSLDLCGKMMDNAVHLIRHLKYSIVGSILPSYLFALGCMDFIEHISHLMDHLTNLLLQLDQVYVLCHAEKDLDHIKYQWLITLENILASLITKVLSSKLLSLSDSDVIPSQNDDKDENKKQDIIDYHTLLNSPLLYNGIQQKEASLISDDNKKKDEDEYDDRDREPQKKKKRDSQHFIQDLINGENEAKILCNWLHTNSKQNRIIPKINDDLHRVIRTAFVSYLYLSNSVSEAFIYARLIKSKGLPRSEVDISPPPELIVLWNQSLAIGQEAYFETKALLQKNEDEFIPDTENKIIDNDILVKSLLNGYEDRALFLLRVNKQPYQQSLLIQNVKKKSIVSTQNKLHLTPTSSGISTKLPPISPKVKAKMKSSWKSLRTRLRVIAHWKALLLEKSIMTTEQRSYYRQIKYFVCKKDVDLSIIEEIIKNRNTFAMKRYDGLQQIRELLSSLSCPSAKQEILKSIFILYNNIQHSLPPTEDVPSAASIGSIQSAPALLSRVMSSIPSIIPPILKGLQSALPHTIQDISDIFHHILQDTTSILSDETCQMSLRAAALGIWSMEIGCSDSNELYSKTDIFSVLSDILSSINSDNIKKDQFQKNDSLRMYMWCFFCLLFKQVTASNNREQFLSAIKVLQQQIEHYESLIMNHDTNPSFPESVLLVNYAKLDGLNEAYKFVLYEDMVKKYISQHGYIPDELKRTIKITRMPLPKQPPVPVPTPPRNVKKEIIVKPSRYSGYKYLSDLRYYSIGFWVKLYETDSTNSMQTILLRGTHSPKSVNPIIYLNKSDRKIHVEITVSGIGAERVQSDQKLTLREWTHVLLIVRPEGSSLQKSLIELYINGKLDKKKQTAYIKGGISSDKAIYVGSVPKVAYNDPSNRGGANCLIMNMTMFLYPISTPDQVTEFYEHSLKQSLCYVTMDNFEIALNVLKSQTLTLNDPLLIKRWLPIKDIIVPLFNILQQLTNDAINNHIYFDEQTVIRIIDEMEWILLLCAPKEIENCLSIDNISELIQFMFDIVSDSLSSNSNSNQWYRRMAMGDRAILFIRHLLQNQEWNEVISSQIEKYMNSSFEYELQQNELQNLLMSLSVFGGNQMLFRSETQIQFARNKQLSVDFHESDGVITKYEPNMLTARFIPFIPHTHKSSADTNSYHKSTARKPSTLVPMSNHDTLPYLTQHYDDIVAPLVHLLVSYQKAMNEWILKPEPNKAIPLPLSANLEEDADREKDKEESKISTEKEQKVETEQEQKDTVNILQNVHHILTMNVAICKKTGNGFEPHSKYPIPDALKTRIALEKKMQQEDDTKDSDKAKEKNISIPTNIEQIDALVESLSKNVIDDIEMNQEDEKQTNSFLNKAEIDYNNYDELTLLSSNILLKILRLFKLFSDDSDEYDKLMSYVSSHDDLMKSLLFFASLPIQFDNPSNWIELEQLQTNISIFIEYYRMKNWIETHDYFEYQLKLQKDYKRKVAEYKAWLEQHKLKLIKDEQEKKIKEAQDAQNAANNETEQKQDKDKESKEQDTKNTENVEDKEEKKQKSEEQKEDKEEKKEKGAEEEEEEPSPKNEESETVEIEQKNEDGKEQKEDYNEEAQLLAAHSLVLDTKIEVQSLPASHSLVLDTNDSSFKVLSPDMDLALNDDDNIVVLGNDEDDEDTEDDEMGMTYLDPHDALIGMDSNQEQSGVDFLSDLSQDQQIPMAQLISMGFSAGVARQCLEITNFNINQAIELAANINNEDEQIQFEDSGDIADISSQPIPSIQPQLGNKPQLKLLPDYNANDSGIDIDIEIDGNIHNLMMMDDESMKEFKDKDKENDKEKDKEKENDKTEIEITPNVDNNAKAKITPPPKPRRLDKLKVKTDQVIKIENEKREKIANDAKKELVSLMSRLPDVGDDVIPDATSNETATKPFDLWYFNKGSGSLSPGISPSNLQVIFHDILKSQYPLPALLRLLTLVNLGLSIHYSRDIVESMFAEISNEQDNQKEDKKEEEHKSSLMSLLDTEQISDFYRFLKLYVFRKKAKHEKSRRRLLKLLIIDCKSSMRTQLIEEAIIELRTAAQNIHKYNSYEWGFRDLTNSDIKILTEPRIELSLAILNEFVTSLSLQQFKRMNICLRTANMPLKCHLFAIITKLLLSLDGDNLSILKNWMECLPVKGLFQLARARYKKETKANGSMSSDKGFGGYFSQLTSPSKSSSCSNKRLLKSQYLTQLMEVVVVAKSIEDRIKELQYKESGDTMDTLDTLDIFVVDITSTSIRIGWKTKQQQNKIWPNCYILQMKDISSSNWKTLMKGNGRQWLINRGLKPRRKYYFRMQPIHIKDETQIISGEWTSAVSVTTLPDLTWNPNKKGRSTVEYFNGNTRVILQSGGDRWRTITANKGFNSGKRSWSIKIFKSDRTFIFVGVCSTSANIDTFCGGDQYGFGYFLQDRYRYHNRSKVSTDRVASSHRFKKDDEITLTLDFNAQSLSMTVNGTKYGELFCGCFDTTEHWFPCVSLYHRGDGVEFVDKSEDKNNNKNAKKWLKFDSAEKKQMEPFEQTFINFNDTFFLCKALSGNGAIPNNILNVAYSEWKSWYDDTVRVITTMHSTLFIDIDPKKCEKYLNHQPNDIITTSKTLGTFKLLGLLRNDDDLNDDDGGVIKEFYYTKEGETDARCAQIDAFIKETKQEKKEEDGKEQKEKDEEKTEEDKESEHKEDNDEEEEEEEHKDDHNEDNDKLDDGRIFTKNEETEMSEFMKNVRCTKTWSINCDFRLLSIASDIACSLDVSIWSLLSIDLCNESHLFDALDVSLKSLTQRFILLKIFNRSLAFVLPFISFDTEYALNVMLDYENNKENIYDDGAMICKYLFLIKSLICSDFKNNLLEKLIADTNTLTAPNDDPYEDPPHLKQVTINRHKARKAMALFNKDKSCILHKECVLKHSIFHQLYLQLKYLDSKDLRRNYVAKLDDGQERTFKVKFFGEGVQDNGGPYRETFHELIDEVFNRDDILPLFIKSPNFKYNDGSVQDKHIPNPSCLDLDLYRFFGRIIGICIRDHILINFNLSSIVWKQLIGSHLNRISLEHDIAEIDCGFVRQYKYVENILQNDVTDLSYINFTYKRSDDKQIDLIPNGKNINVTLENRLNYLKLIMFYKIHEFDIQIAAIRSGLSSIIPLHLLPIYTYRELENKICGNSDFSIDLLKCITVYEGHLTPSSYHVVMFWNMMSSFNATQKEMFLRFTWAKTRIPNKKSLFGGNTFKLQPFASSIPSNKNVDLLLPRSHTCFFSLQLPPYSNLKIMKERFLYAFNNTASMDRDLKLQDSELYNYDHDDL